MNQELKQADADINRREVLSLAWLATLGAAFAQAVSVAYSAARWTDPTDASLKQKQRLPIDLGYSRPWPMPSNDPVLEAHGRLWLVKTDDGVLALVNSCTHLGCGFAWKPDQQEYICPCHGQAYSKTGVWLRGPADRGADRFALRVFDRQDNLVAQTDNEGSPIPVPDGCRLEADPRRIIRGAARPKR